MKKQLRNSCRIKFERNCGDAEDPSSICLVRNFNDQILEEELVGVIRFKFVADFDDGDMVPYIHIVKEVDNKIAFQHIDHQRLIYKGPRSIVLSGRINLYEYENCVLRICDGKEVVDCWVRTSELVPLDAGVELEDIDPDLF